MTLQRLIFMNNTERYPNGKKLVFVRHLFWVSVGLMDRMVGKGSFIIFYFLLLETWINLLVKSHWWLLHEGSLHISNWLFSQIITLWIRRDFTHSSRWPSCILRSGYCLCGVFSHVHVGSSRFSRFLPPSKLHQNHGICIKLPLGVNVCEMFVRIYKIIRCEYLNSISM